MTTTTDAAEKVYRGVIRMPNGSKGTFNVSNVNSVAEAQSALKNESGARVALILVPKETHIHPKSSPQPPTEPEVA